MKKNYTKKQIVEAITYWKKQLSQINESEDMVDRDSGMLRSSACALIYKDGHEKLGDDVEIEEIYFPMFGLRGRTPVKLDQKDTEIIKKLQNNGDGYRVMAYVYTGSGCGDIKWTNACNTIEDRGDYENYVDPESSDNRDYPEEYDEEFAKTFPTYDSWIKYKTDGAVKAFERILADSDDLVYKYAGEEIKVDPDGVVYTIIVWRA